MSGQEKLEAWHKAELAALEAQQQVDRLGQAAADPRAAELFLRAKALREEADRLLDDILVQSGARPGKP